ncbi:hypothetical protein H4R35_002365 [Dimargaris xerosporica]|nr:hypothetical protein H4R35_002365 [Dimargaris xerosporica]
MSLIPEYDSDSSLGESDGSLSPANAPSAPSSDSTTRKRVTIVVDLPKRPAATVNAPTDASPPAAKKHRAGASGLLSMLPAPKKPAGALATPSPTLTAPPSKPRPTSPKLATAPADTIPFFPLGPEVTQAPTTAVPARLPPLTPRQVDSKSPVPVAANTAKVMPQMQYDPNAQYRYAYTDLTDTPATSSPSDPGIATLDSEALRRLGGRRAIRELPQVQEVAQQSQLEPMAYLTSLQHSANSQKPTSVPDHLKPSSMQKRKHNIMYLAYQAAESETKLREHHATGRKTKRETQGKYGF